VLFLSFDQANSIENVFLKRKFGVSILFFTIANGVGGRNNPKRCGL